ncbi:MAG: hypothetical protein AAFQ05_07735 [Pseudomonadota bacterium]
MVDAKSPASGPNVWAYILRRVAKTVLVLTAGLWGAASLAQSDDQDPLLLSATDGGYRYFEVTDNGVQLRDAPSPQARKNRPLEKGKRFVNLGCSHHSDALWCEGRAIDGNERGFLPATSVQPAMAADGTFPKGPDDSRNRAKRKDFDYDSQIKCAQNAGDALGTCRIQLASAGAGDATALVTFPNSFSRELYFTNGAFRRANTTMSGVGTDTEWMLEDEVFFVRVDDQRFEIPAQFIARQ